MRTHEAYGSGMLAEPIASDMDRDEAHEVDAQQRRRWCEHCRSSQPSRGFHRGRCRRCNVRHVDALIESDRDAVHDAIGYALRTLTKQGVDRMRSILKFPHPGRSANEGDGG